MPKALILAAALLAQNGVPQCGDRDHIAARLLDGYDERPLGRGTSTNGNLMLELFVSPTGSTWTAIISEPNGNACVVAAGDNWRWRGPEPEGPET